MIIPCYSPTATERILPRVTMDFTSGVLDPRVTFTRTTSASEPATFINSQGLVELATNNQPRFDFNPTTLVCRGLLLEETKTNFFLYSSDMSNAAWGKTAVTVDATLYDAPDGTTTANKITFAAGNAAALFYQNFSPALSLGNYRYSFWARADAPTTVRGYVINNGSSTASPVFNVTTTWTRLSALRGSTGTGITFVGLRNNATGTTGSIYIWGQQLENGAEPTSYIPTESTTLTRNADVAVMTGTNFSDWWQATNGAAVIIGSQAGVAKVSPWWQFDDNTADNLIALRGNLTNPELYIKATTDQAQIDAGTFAADTVYGFGGTWNTDSCAAAVSGAAAVTDTSATMPVVTQARLGSDGTNYMNGWLQKFMYWPQRVTDAEIRAFSKL